MVKTAYLANNASNLLQEKIKMRDKAVTAILIVQRWLNLGF